jgi:secreted Zn-dependent insulinase-like peptidase
MPSKIYITNLIETFKETYNNAKFKNPLSYSLNKINESIYNSYNNEDILNELNLITYDEIKNYLVNLFEDSSLTSFIYVNIKLSNISNLFPNFNKQYQNINNPVLKINKPIPFNINHPNINEKSNCVIYYYYVGNFTPDNIILLILLVDIIGINFYNELRTNKQLGYLVNMKYLIYDNNYYICQQIQSDKPVKTIEDNINIFNKDIINIINKCDFNQFIIMLKNKLSEPDNNLIDIFSKYLSEIISQQYLFNRNELIFKKLNTINKGQLIKFVNMYINDKNKLVFITNGN